MNLRWVISGRALRVIAAWMLVCLMLAAWLPGASAQVSLCTITGQARNPDGTIAASAIFKVFRVDSSAGTIFYKQIKTYTQLLDGTWKPALQFERGSTIWAFMAAPGFDRDKDNGSPIQIPDAPTATLASLQAAVSLPSQVPVVIGADIAGTTGDIAQWSSPTTLASATVLRTLRATGSVTNQSSAIQAVIDAAGAVDGGIILLEPGVYGVNASLVDGGKKNITLMGRNVVFKALASNAILSGAFDDWRFEGIEFQGAVSLTNSKNPSFRGCKFTPITENYALFLAATDGVRVGSSLFNGARAGVMAAGAQDPTAVPAATYGLGVHIAFGVTNTVIEDCEFNFCEVGIGDDGNLNSRSSGLTIRRCYLRGDWWNHPYVRSRKTFDAYNSGTRVLTLNAGGLNALLADSPIITFPVQITTGSGFTSNSQGVIAGVFVNPRKGDVFETTDGKRAEVLSVPTATLTASFSNVATTITVDSTEGFPSSGTLKVDSETLTYSSKTGTTFTGLTRGGAASHSSGASIICASQVTIKRWEANDTFLPITFTGTGTSWRLTRYYASGTTVLSDTTVQLYSDPVNVFTGERLVADAGLTPLSYQSRILAKLIYPGMHINGGMDGLLVENNYFVGSWGDQVSMVRSQAPRVIGNKIWYGQDEGVTLTFCPRAVVMANDFQFCGASAVYYGGSDYSTIIGNTVNTWGIVNRNSLAAFSGPALSVNICGNPIEVVAGGPGSGSVFVVDLRGPSTDTVVSGNPGSGAARTSGVVIQDDTGVVTIREMAISALGDNSMKNANAIVASNMSAIAGRKRLVNEPIRFMRINLSDQIEFAPGGDMIFFKGRPGFYDPAGTNVGYSIRVNDNAQGEAIFYNEVTGERPLRFNSDGSSLFGGPVTLPTYTTTQRDALTPSNGMLIYNSTTGKIQGRAGGAWVDLH